MANSIFPGLLRSARNDRKWRHCEAPKEPRQPRKKAVILLTVLLFLGGGFSLLGNDTPSLSHQSWSFQGPFGTFNRKDLQHGFQIYKEVCAACHGLKHLRFRDLEALGYTPEEIKAIAAEYKIATVNEEGEPTERPALPTDPFPGPYKNEQAARTANNGALPPDLSLITKARVGGPDYVYALLTSYESAPPADVHVAEGMHYNPVFPGGQIAMIPPLSDGLVTYNDGEKPSLNQMAKDVVTFLSWTTEPELETRKSMGYKVLIYFLVFTALMYAVMKVIWRRVK